MIILGDGRMDSPGFCANFCTYTMMDADTLDIIDMEIVDKREVSLKSGNMERKGLLRGLEKLKEEDVSVKEVVTDAHSSITTLIRKFII